MVNAGRFDSSPGRSTHQARHREEAMTSTPIADISDILYIDDIYGDYADDYDTNAIQGTYVNALQAAARDASGASSIIVHASGMVFVDIDDPCADQAHDLDWRALADGIDLRPIIKANDLHRRYA